MHNSIAAKAKNVLISSFNCFGNVLRHKVSILEYQNIDNV